MRHLSDIQAIPRALERMLEGARKDFESLVRRTGWNQAVIYFIGDSAGYFAALRGALAIETQLRRPAIARPVSEFEAYTLPSVEPRSLVINVTANGASESAKRLGPKLESGGAALWILDGRGRLLNWREAGAQESTAESEPAAVLDFCLNAALTYLAVVASRVLKAQRKTDREKTEDKFQELPGQVEWIFSQLADAAKALAAKLAECGRLRFVGGGFFHPTALHAAWRIEGFSRKASVVEHAGDTQDIAAARGESEGVVIVTGSECRVKSDLHDTARALRHSGKSLFAITDGNDRELVMRSEMSVLLPQASESTGSLFALALLESVAGFMARAK